MTYINVPGKFIEVEIYGYEKSTMFLDSKVKINLSAIEFISQTRNVKDHTVPVDEYEYYIAPYIGLKSGDKYFIKEDYEKFMTRLDIIQYPSKYGR